MGVPPSRAEGVEQQIMQLCRLLNVTNGSELSDAIGYSRGSVTQWRKRGAVPRKAVLAVERLARGGAGAAVFTPQQEDRLRAIILEVVAERDALVLELFRKHAAAILAGDAK